MSRRPRLFEHHRLRMAAGRPRHRTDAQHAEHVATPWEKEADSHGKGSFARAETHAGAAAHSGY
jgi:hypothetical protein